MQLTPSEILKRIPELKKIGWSVTDIGRLLSKDLLKGVSSRSKHITLIELDSVYDLLDYRNNIIDSKKISVSRPSV